MTTNGSAPHAAIWRLRKEDGQIYGPADPGTVKAWGAAGRIGPGDEISIDDAPWMAAAEIESLDLCWLIEDPEGNTYGPFHIEACQALAREQELVPGSRLRNIRTGAVRLPDGATAKDTASAVPPTWSALARDRDHLADAADRWKKLYEEEEARAARTEEESAARTRELEQEVVRLHTAVDAAERERERIARVQEKALRATGDPDAAALLAVHTELSRSYETLVVQCEEKAAECEALRADADRVRRDAEAATEAARATTTRERDAADRAQRRVETLERAYADVIRSLREINDRYIQQRAAAGAPDREATSRGTRDAGIRERPAPSAATPSGGPHRGPRIRLTR